MVLINQFRNKYNMHLIYGTLNNLNHRGFGSKAAKYFKKTRCPCKEEKIDLKDRPQSTMYNKQRLQFASQTDNHLSNVIQNSSHAIWELGNSQHGKIIHAKQYEITLAEYDIILLSFL